MYIFVKARPAKQQSSKAAKQQSSKAARQQSSKAARQQSKAQQGKCAHYLRKGPQLVATGRHRMPSFWPQEAAKAAKAAKAARQQGSKAARPAKQKSSEAAKQSSARQMRPVSTFKRPQQAATGCHTPPTFWPPEAAKAAKAAQDHKKRRC